MDERPNPYRDARRERKAQALARYLWAHLTRGARVDRMVPDGVASFSQAERDELARLADQLSPSPRCWLRVVALLRERVDDERHWLSLDERAS